MVIIRYRRCRIGYGSASRITEAKTDGRKETTDGGGHGGDEERSARKWQCGPLPSETKQERRWRTRPDPFDGVWEEEILPLLRGEAAGRLRATTIIEWLEEKFPGRFSASQLRTLQRRLQDWRALNGPDQEVYFPQEHPPGREAQLDFTHCNSLGVTIGGRRYRHLLFHLVLSHSGWRYAEVVAGETFVALKQWLQQLHTYGLLSGAFRPDGEIRRLRSYLRQRAMLVEYAAQHIQHMQKALTQMNVKLHHIISDITGKTGMDIIEAIVGGQRDPQQLTQLRDPKIKADEATIAKSLQGHWREEHIFELTQALGLYRVYQDKIAQCDREIEAQLERFEDHSNGDLPAAKSGRRRSKGNAPRFDVWTHLYRMTGVDLTRIDGVDAYTALKVVSEIGTDMTKWTSAKHFASWLGLSPNNRITGGKVMSSKTKPSANRAAAALRLAANALHRSDSALGAFLRRKEAQLGATKAITATAHKLARLIYSMLRYGQEYVDAGAEYYESQYQQRALRAAQRRAAQLGYRLVPMPDAPEHTTYAPPGAPIAS